MSKFAIEPRVKNVQSTITFNRFTYAVLEEDACRDKISISSLVNQILARHYTERVRLKEFEEQTKYN